MGPNYIFDLPHHYFQLANLIFFSEVHELLGLFSGEVSIWESTVTIFTTMIIKLMEDRSLGTLFYDLGQGGLNLFFLTIVGHTIPFSFFGHSISVSVCYNWSSTNVGHNNIQHHLRFSWLNSCCI